MNPRSAADSSARGIEVLRVALGLVWVANLVFVFAPAANYWDTFAGVASSFAPTTPGGGGLADFVAAHSLVFAWLVAAVSVYLAVAFLGGFTTRLACLVGFAGSLVLFWTQYGAVFSFPGGTDVGAHPLYLAIYVALFVGRAGRLWALDGRIWKVGRPWLRELTHWIAAPA